MRADLKHSNRHRRMFYMYAFYEDLVDNCYLHRKMLHKIGSIQGKGLLHSFPHSHALLHLYSYPVEADVASAPARGVVGLVQRLWTRTGGTSER